MYLVMLPIEFFMINSILGISFVMFLALPKLNNESLPCSSTNNERNTVSLSFFETSMSSKLMFE